MTSKKDSAFSAKVAAEYLAGATQAQLREKYNLSHYFLTKILRETHGLSDYHKKKEKRNTLAAKDRERGVSVREIAEKYGMTTQWASTVTFDSRPKLGSAFRKWAREADTGDTFRVRTTEFKSGRSVRSGGVSDAEKETGSAFRVISLQDGSFLIECLHASKRR